MYLYIFEDSAMVQTNLPPTPEDLLAIDQGVLTIIGFTDGKYVEFDGSGMIEPLPNKD